MGNCFNIPIRSNVSNVTNVTNITDVKKVVFILTRVYFYTVYMMNKAAPIYNIVSTLFSDYYWTWIVNILLRKDLWRAFVFYGHIKSLFIKSNLKQVLCFKNPHTHTHTQKNQDKLIYFMMLQNQNVLCQHLRIKIEFIINVYSVIQYNL